MKEDLKNVFKSKCVLGPSGKRKYCWRKFWDDECEELFSKYATKYRSNDEAWFCLLHNIEPPKCPICGNLCTFTGRLKSGNEGYNTVCENCSANSLESKRISASKTKKSYSKEKVEQIVSQRKKTNLERYGEENHMCYGSKSFRECMLKRYGNEFYSNHNKAAETNIKRYGVRCNFELPNFQEESIKKKIERYGDASNYSKTRLTNLERYGCEHIGQVKEAQNKARESKKKHISKLESEYKCTHQSKLFAKYGQGWKSLDLDMAREQ